MPYHSTTIQDVSAMSGGIPVSFTESSGKTFLKKAFPEPLSKNFMQGKIMDYIY